MTIFKTIMFYGILQLTLITAFGQHIFMVEKPGTVNNLKYSTGDRMDLKTKTGERVSGIINQVRDTAIVVNYYLVMNDDIAIVYTRRAIFSAFSSVGTTGGLAYVGIDGFNNLINDERPVFRATALKTGGIMFGAGMLLKFISKRKRHINNQDWRIKVLDFSILKDPGIYAKPGKRIHDKK